uniref:Bacterial Ig-like domain-containing protein n=1 Tax=candidate division WOR-3 bacterium TaxID=2052148 RepID=A0A7C4YRE6_UNCW3
MPKKKQTKKEDYQIKIDGNDFGACREAEGFFWLDWAKIEPGKHSIIAEIFDPEKGKVLKKSKKIEVEVT